MAKIQVTLELDIRGTLVRGEPDIGTDDTFENLEIEGATIVRQVRVPNTVFPGLPRYQEVRRNIYSAISNRVTILEALDETEVQEALLAERS